MSEISDVQLNICLNNNNPAAQSCVEARCQDETEVLFER